MIYRTFDSNCSNFKKDDWQYNFMFIKTSLLYWRDLLASRLDRGGPYEYVTLNEVLRYLDLPIEPKVGELMGWRINDLFDVRVSYNENGSFTITFNCNSLFEDET